MTQTFRPEPSGTLLRIARITVPAVITSLGQSAFAGRNFGEALLAGIVVSVLGVALSVLYFWLRGRNTWVEAGTGELRVQNWLGLSHTVAAEHIVKAMFVPAVVTTNGGNRNVRGARLVIRDESGRAVLRWSEPSWTPAQMRALVSSLGLPLT